MVTTLLDVLGLLLVAAGAVGALLPVIGWAALAPAGAVVLAGSWWAARQTRPGEAR
jgi:hypothetical protein